MHLKWLEENTEKYLLSEAGFKHLLKIRGGDLRISCSNMFLSGKLLTTYKGDT